MSLSLAAPLTALAAETGCTDSAPYPDEALATMAFDANMAAPRLPEDQSVTVGELRIHRQNIFPVERHWLARQANRFNILTRESVLRAALPFVAGSKVDQRTLDEAERILRAKAYLYDARVLVRRLCGDVVDLDIVVRDVWTLTPNIGYGRGGGEDKLTLGFSDVNFLGLGKDVELIYIDDEDRKGFAPFYRDPNLFGSRWQLEGGYADNDDGELAEFQLARPFYALDTRWSFAVDATHFRREQGLYYLNDKQFEIDASSRTARVTGGLSEGRRGRSVDRVLFGAAYERHEFEYPAGFPDPGVSEREFAYPFIGWQHLDDRYEKERNLERIGETEDLHLGLSSYLEVGYSPDAVSDGDQLLFRGSLEGRSFLTPLHLVSARLSVNGRVMLDSSSVEDTVVDLEAAYRWHHAPQWAFAANVNLTAAFDLPVDRQLLLGGDSGDSGMRGYPSRYQTGDRRFVVSLEERYYSNLFPFGLFRLGAAVFVDAGRAWYEDDRPAWEPSDHSGDHFDTLVNVGVGLRIESVRTRRDRVIHFDIAKPLVDGPEVGSLEVTVTVRRTI